MLDVATTPEKRQRFDRLMKFAQEVLAVCKELGISPILSGSLAVFAYTRNPAIEVHDVDLSCSESYFLRLCQALQARGVACRIRDWQVLQATRDDLKVEFDAAERWMHGIPKRSEVVHVEGLAFQAVGIDGLRELYRRGLLDTAGKKDVHNQIKHRAIEEKLRLLDALGSLIRG